MPIQNTGQDLRLRGNSGDGVTDIKEEISNDPYTGEASLGTLNTVRYATVAEGSVTTGRAMSEMQGYSVFTSALPQTEATGALGESLLFDGSNYTFHRIPSLTSNRTTFTYSGWYKFNNLDSGNIIIMESGPTSGNSYISLRIDNANNNIYGLVGINPGNPWLVRSPNLFFDTSSWYHFVFAVDTTKDYINDRLRVYVNGIEIKFTYTANTIAQNQAFSINDGSSRFCIARTARTDQYAQWGQTVVADAKFIDGQQLRPDSFGKLLNGIWIPKAFNTASTDTLVTSNLIANYELNGNANDTSGSATTYNGTASNVSFLKNNYGILEIEGSSDKVDFSTIPSSVFNNATVSVSTWVNMKALVTTSQAGSHVFMGKGNWQIQVSSSSAYGFLFTKFHASSGGNNGNNMAAYYPEGGPKLNRWYHLVAVDDTPNGNGIKLYLDGKLVAENSAYTNIDDNGWVAGIANYPGRTGGNYRVGETQIYTKALSASEVLQNYNATKHKYTYGLNGFWLPLNNTSTGSIVDDSSLKLHLDASDNSSYSGSGTNWNDLTSNNNDGTISGANYLSSTNGGVFDFDGSNDKVTITTLGTFLASSDNKTYSAWFKSDGPSSGNREIFSSYGDGTNNFAIRLYMRPHQNSGDLVYGSKAGGNTVYGYSNTTNINNGEWYHACVVHNTALNTLTLYVNGKFDGAVNIGSGTASDDFYIGTYGTAYYWDGKIAQVRAYNKALTAQEIITNYRATQGNYEQVSTVDISGNANSFTATNINATDHIKDEPLDNYATLDPNNKIGSNALSEGNLKVTGSNNNQYVASTLEINSGKFYAEYKLLYTPDSAGNHIGIIPGKATISDVQDLNNFAVDYQHAFSIWLGTSTKNARHRVGTGSGRTDTTLSYKYVNNDFLNIAIDFDNKKVWFGKNGTWYNSGNPETGVNASHTLDSSVGSIKLFDVCYKTGIWNFGQKAFEYDPPTGFKALSTSNLTAPAFDPDGATQDKPSNYFKAVTYQGNGVQQGDDYGYKEGSRAAMFNGSNSYITLVDSITTEMGNNNFSFSFWVYFDTLTQYDTPIAFQKNYRYYVDTTTAGVLHFYDGTSLSTPSSTIATGGWYNIVVTKSSTTGRKIYVNGSVAASDSSTTNAVNEASSSGKNLIGAYNSSGTYNYHLDGKIDEVRIFNKELNSTEVGYLADDDTANIDAISNLVAHYDMEGDANDSSGYSTVDDHYFFVGDLGNQLTDVRLNTQDSEFTYTKPSGYDPWGGALDPSNTSGSQTFNFTESNKRWTKVSTSGYYNSVWSTLAHNTGKKYFEIEFLNKNIQFGISKLTTADNWTDNVKNNSIVYVDYVTNNYEYSTTNLGQGQVIYGNTNGSSVIGIACDFDNQTFYYYYNNSLVDTATIASSNYNGTESNITYTQDKPYGNIDVGFAPDFVWVKSRSLAASNGLYDSVRGTAKWLRTDGTDAEQTQRSNGFLSSFDSNGFSLKDGDSTHATYTDSYETHQEGQDYIAWAWKAGGKAVENTDGTIASQVSSNQDAGFSIVKWTGDTTSNPTVGHGLNQEPDLYIVKELDNGTVSWLVGGNSTLFPETATTASFLRLNTTDDIDQTGIATFGNSGQNLIKVGARTNNGEDSIAYCFHSVDGFSKIGSYTGNASTTDGPFVYTGFKPAWIMIKQSSASGTRWIILDNARRTENPATGWLSAEYSGTEQTDSSIALQFMSNGFKVGNPGTSNASLNSNGQTYIYMAFAEDPVKYSNGVATLGDGNEFIQGGNYPEDNFNTTLYTGDGSTSLTVNGGFNFTPDAIWIKNRSAGSNHILQNTIIGINAPEYPDATYVGGANSVFGHVNSVSKGSFNVDDGGSTENNANYSGNNYVAWSWKAAGNENTYNILENGTITSSASASTLGLNIGSVTPDAISANRDNGFSIIKYTGPNQAATVDHGLSKPPEIYIIKNTTNTDNWRVYHKNVGGTKYLNLDDNSSAITASTVFNNSDPTSKIFNIGTAGSVSENNSIFTVYAWHSVPGFSKIGSYSGSNSTVTISTGFEPRLIIIKRSNGGNDWIMYDTARSDGTLMNDYLVPNTSASEYVNTSLVVNATPTGFTIASGLWAGMNASGGEYIYMAFAHR